MNDPSPKICSFTYIANKRRAHHTALDGPHSGLLIDTNREKRLRNRCPVRARGSQRSNTPFIVRTYRVCELCDSICGT
jgi:hypothetical protein